MTIHDLLAELREGEVPAGAVSVEPYPGAMDYGLKQLMKQDRKRIKKRERIAFRKAGFVDEVRAPKPKPKQIGQEGFPTKLSTRGVREMNVLTRGLKYKAVELDKKSEVLKGTGGVTMKQQQWLDRHVLHPVTRINDQLDAINAKVKKTFFEDCQQVGRMLTELRQMTSR